MSPAKILSFYHLVHCGSITGAAKQMGLAKSTLSLQLTQLEQEVGVRLMQRNTRSLVLTAAGKQLFEHAKSLHEVMAAAEQAMVDFSEELQGTLVVSAPVDSAEPLIAPIIHRFCQQYPKVRVQFRVTNELLNLVKEGVDVAFRTGALADSSMIGRQVSSFQLVLVATADYLAKRGTPTKLNGLEQHDCLVHESTPKWQFDSGESIHPEAKIQCSNLAVLKELTLQGAGIGRLPNYRVQNQLQAGQLIRVLPDSGVTTVPYFQLYPNRQSASKAAQRFIEFSQQQLQSAIT